MSYNANTYVINTQILRQNDVLVSLLSVYYVVCFLGIDPGVYRTQHFRNPHQQNAHHNRTSQLRQTRMLCCHCMRYLASTFRQIKSINTLRQRQNGRHFADDTFNRIFVNENFRISIEFSLKFVPKGPINNIPALVQIVAWRRPGDKPLSESMMVRLLTQICVTRPQCVNMFSMFLQSEFPDIPFGYLQFEHRTSLFGIEKL